jgi:lipopolysaccharide/colanic/teichoic acid biosynthesis glycosyltransferase
MPHSTKPSIALILDNSAFIVDFTNLFKDHFEIFCFDNDFQFVQWTNKNPPVKLIVSGFDLLGVNGITLRKNCKNIPKTANVPFFLIVDKITDHNKHVAIYEHFADIFDLPIQKEEFLVRANYVIKHPPRYHHTIKNSKNDFADYSMPFMKRLFDIVVSGFALLALSPVFLIVALLIRLESKGPVFYYSKRVGTGYNVFKFYKFRSMRQGADNMLKDLKHLNQYANAEPQKVAEPESNSDQYDLKNYLCETCKLNNTPCQSPLYMDGEQICEKSYLENNKSKQGATFIKIENDPRITRIGRFIRNTSIDELPQLYNVLKGDMSIVGNRPLPMYEAEKITTDQFALRFIAPAGITGLWQVTKRGKGGPMSEEERMELDNQYAKTYSFWNDIKLILKTIPALFQKENV